MKARKKYLALILTTVVITAMSPATVYASPEESDVEAIVIDEPSDLDTGEFLEDTADEIEVEIPDDLVGAGVQVGDNVTATFDPAAGTVIFTSNGGTLWGDWLYKSKFEAGKIKSIDATGTLYLPADSSSLFSSLNNLVSLNTSYFKTTNVSNMNNMFFECSSLANLDLRSFNTSNVTDMHYMFYGCSSLKNLDLSSFNTSNVTDVQSMFYDCGSLTNLDLGSFNTSSMTRMNLMFYGCSSLTDLDLSKFDTSKVTDMFSMFANCSNLIKLDLSSFNTSNVTHMPFMFSGCSSLKNLDLGSFDTSSVVSSAYMFDACTSLEILRTPKKHTAGGVALPFTMYDNPGKAYTELPVLSKSIVLGKTQKIAHEYAAKPISECTVTLKPTSYTYDGTSKKPAVTVKDGTRTLTSGTDYTVAYSNNKNVGTAVVTITATETGDYKGTATANFTIKKAGGNPSSLVFPDVRDPKHPYYNAIYWAVDAAITKGYPDGTFGINRNCTRGEMMMFLWRYAGKPSPKTASKSPFKDVPKTHTFYKAILWGSQKGITKGYSDGTFGVNRNVSRGECMMFLWRLKGKPTPKAVTKAPFPDVPKSHAFYTAVLWGYQKKITTGFTEGKLKGKFGVNESCTRGQIVTFLYRARTL